MKPTSTRRKFLSDSAFATAACALGASALAQQGPPGAPKVQQHAAPRATAGRKRPNILFVFSDEHRWSSLPFTQMPELKAPTFTRLAQEGLSLNCCVSNNPVCVPYRAMLISGMWPHRNTAVANEYFGNSDMIGKDAPTIAHTFKAGGYTTGYVGKWHLKPETTYQAGFDSFQHWLWGDDHWNTKWRDVSAGETEWRTYTKHNLEGMTDHALSFMRAHAQDEKPFLMMLSWNPPHWRWDDAPKEFLDLYPDGKLSVRPNADPEQTNHLWYRNYHAHITANDAYMDKLLAGLDEMGIADNTIVIYTSDHGSGFTSQGYSSKTNPFDETIRVPFLMRYKGHVTAGKTLDTPVGTIDLYPTLCGLAGITPPDHCGGQDLSGHLMGRDGPAPEGQLTMLVTNPKLFFRQANGEKIGPNEHWPFRGIRTSRYTYTVRADGEWHLFDNQADPYQMKDLKDDPAFASLKADLRKKLEKILAQSETPYLPADMRDLPLEKRIAAQDEHFSLARHAEHLAKLRTQALNPLLARASNQAQREALNQAADRAFDRDFQIAWGGLRMKLWSFGATKDKDKRQALTKQYDALEAQATKTLADAADKILR